MKGEDTTVREELGDIETGWIPWVLAAAYFPVYIVLDFVAGDVAAARMGLPQSVAVGLVSLTISSVVVLLFVLVNVGKALRRPRHSMGASSGPVRRGLARVLSVPVRGVRLVFGALGAAVLSVFVAARDGVALLIAGIWRVVAGVGGIVYRALALLLRPFVVLAALFARPFLAVVSVVDGRGSDPPGDEPVSGELPAASDPVTPLRRTDDADDGTDRDDDAAEASPGDDDPDDRGAASHVDASSGGENGKDGGSGVDGPGEGDEDGDADRPDVATSEPEVDIDAAGEVGTASEADEWVVPGDPSGVSRADDGADPTPGLVDDPAAADDRAEELVDAGERSVDDPDEEEWPDDWISASDV